MCTSSEVTCLNNLELKSNGLFVYQVRSTVSINWETDLQKSIDFLLNPFFVFRNDLYVNLLHYMYTCCYTKMK